MKCVETTSGARHCLPTRRKGKGRLLHEKYFTWTLWSESHSVMSDSLWPHGLHSPWNSPGQNTGVGSRSLLWGIFLTQRSNPGLLHYRQILLTAEPQGKPENIGVGSLSLLQGIFLIQESNWDLLHCRWALYQLSYQGSPTERDPLVPQNKNTPWLCTQSSGFWVCERPALW